MKRSVLFRILLRSLTIQASYNYKRKQNVGFAFAMMPALKRIHSEQISALAGSHLEMFNTHPYMAAAVIGAVVRLEEEGEREKADRLKKALMGPYAAIGDSFFWGALRLLSAICAVILGYLGYLMAPLAYLALYGPAHAWVRVKGFYEGYRQGSRSIEYIRGLDLPGATARIRIVLLVLTGILAAVVVEPLYDHPDFMMEISVKIMALISIILFCFVIRGKVSPLVILYGTTFVCMVLSIGYGGN